MRIDSFNVAKRLMERSVYSDIAKKTVYCAADFEGKKIVNPNGFFSTKFEKRAGELEWEHIVPAENFGNAFIEWREGHPECIDSSGKPFRGRNCASKMNMKYRYMQSDMYNLYPIIGAVNALRSNRNFVAYGTNKEALGSCQMYFEGNKVVPPDRAKGIIARTYMYMGKTYSQYFKISDSNKKMFESWDKQFPVTPDECKRSLAIQRLQGNINTILMIRCRASNLW